MTSCGQSNSGSKLSTSRAVPGGSLMSELSHVIKKTVGCHLDTLAAVMKDFQTQIQGLKVWYDMKGCETQALSRVAAIRPLDSLESFLQGT